MEKKDAFTARQSASPCPERQLTRQNAEAASTDRTQSGRPWKSTWWTFESGGTRFRVKDVRHSHPVYRFTVGRWLIARENRIYKRLAGLDFVPRFATCLDADAMAVENLDARVFSSLISGSLSPAVLVEVAAYVRALHARGVVHLDLRHRGNILIRHDGRPALIDFESALYLPRPLRFLLPVFAWIDHSALRKFRARHYPESISTKAAKQERRFHLGRRLWPFGRIWPPRWWTARRAAKDIKGAAATLQHGKAAARD